jgi:hypothetical protein
MSAPHTPEEEKEEKEDKKLRFDMYKFLSRKDVLLAEALIILLLLWLFGHLITATPKT